VHNFGVDTFAKFVLGHHQIIACLKVHPELGTVTEVATKTQRRELKKVMDGLFQLPARSSA